MDIIESLGQEHAQLMKALENIKKIGIGRTEGKKSLFLIKKNLLAHLEREDKEFYPILAKLAKKDENLKTTLEFFAKDMQEISKKVLDFFDKYSQESAGLVFAKDAGQIYAALYKRIAREEKILFAAYKQGVSEV